MAEAERSAYFSTVTSTRAESTLSKSVIGMLAIPMLLAAEGGAHTQNRTGK